MDVEVNANSLCNGGTTGILKNGYLSAQRKLAIKEALDHFFVSQKYKEEGESQGICIYFCQICKDENSSCNCQHLDSLKRELKPKKSSTLQRSNSLFGKSFNGDEKAIANGSPFATLTHQVKNTPSNENGYKSGNKFSGRKSDPMSSKTLPKSRKPEFGERKRGPKRLSLSDKDDWRGKDGVSPGTPFPNWPRSSTALENDQGNENHVGTPNSPQLNGDAKPKRVMFFYKEPDSSIHWVMAEEDLKEFEFIQNTLVKDCDSYEWIEPELGVVCGVKYSDEWFRAKVVETKPKVVVHFIDYGNSSECPSCMVKKLPPEIRMIKQLVYRIEFDDNAPEEYKKNDLYGTMLNLETKRISSLGVHVVEVIKDKDTPKINKVNSPFFKVSRTQRTNGRTKDVSGISSSMDLVRNGSKGMVSFLPGALGMRFGSLIPNGDDEEIESNLNQLSTLEGAELKHVKALEGDYVLVVDYEENKRRGKVVSVLGSTYYVLLIDYGTVILSDCVYQLPEKRKNLVHLAVKATFDEILSVEKIRKNGGKFQYQVTGEQESGGKWPCEFTDATETIAIGYIEFPSEEGATVPMVVPVESGAICEMTVIVGANSCYVRPLDEKTARMRLEMSVKMAGPLRKADPLSTPPEVGKMYAAKNKKDDCFHRVVVKSVKNESLKVLFVDCGTIELVEVKDLKPLPVNIKVLPFFAVKVTLSGITVESLSDFSRKYLNKLIERNVELVLSFEGNEGDEVILKEKKTGVVVNDMIENPKNEGKLRGGNNEDDGNEGDDDDDEIGLESDDEFEWESNMSASTGDVIMKDELKELRVTPKEKYNFLLQHIDENEFLTTLTFWMADTGASAFIQLGTVLGANIVKYCEETREPYRPQVQELCLAMYEGEWYRALTKGVKDNKYEVFFVDYGNSCTLKPKYIRRIKREFVEIPAVAFKCTLSSKGRLIGKPELKKKVYKRLNSHLNSVFHEVLVDKYEFGMHHLTISEIEEILLG